MPINYAHGANKQRGSGFIEILISLLLISTGVMVLVTSQLNVLANNRESFYRTQATLLAYDIMDRARANRTQARSGNYAIAHTGTTGTACASACTPLQIAQTDLVQWRGLLAAQLPNGSGAITAIAGLANSYTVQVRWTPREGGTTTLDFGMRL